MSEVTETVTVAVLLVYKQHCIEAEWSKMLTYLELTFDEEAHCSTADLSTAD